MVATKSNMIPLGTTAPPFTLLDTRTGEIISFSNQTEGKGFLFAFICNHCPFVIHLKNHFPTLFNQWNKEGVKVYTILLLFQTCSMHHPNPVLGICLSPV